VILWLVALFVLAISYYKNNAKTRKALRNCTISLRELAPGILGIISFVGLLLAVVSEESLANLFAMKGLWANTSIAAIGAVMSIPGPVAFPLAGALLKLGATPASLGTFISTLTMVGFVTAPLESSYFGGRFTFLRQLFSFLSALAIGFIMGVLL
jgi:uncharacterized membrane protein YraQ (UPF0718 family)